MLFIDFAEYAEESVFVLACIRLPDKSVFQHVQHFDHGSVAAALNVQMVELVLIFIVGRKIELGDIFVHSCDQGLHFKQIGMG
ncbi:hypothetical protein D1872_286190 [compost metagenome]